MTRRLGGLTNGRAALLASLSLGLALACGSGIVACGGDNSNNPGTDAGPDAPVVETGGGQDSAPDNSVQETGPQDTGPDVKDSGSDVDADVTPPPTLGTPTFNPMPGTIMAGTTVAITVPNAPDGGQVFIYYTTDGTNPNPSSPVYNGPIQVTMTETIRAMASGTGYTSSAVAVGTFTVMAPEGGPPTTIPAFTPPSETSNNDILLSLSSGAGATICYTLDGTTTPTCGSNGACTGTSQTYNAASQVSINGSVTGSGANAGAVTVQAIACESGQPSSMVASQKYTLQASPPTMVNPMPGTVPYKTGGYTPTITSSTTGSTIWASTDGTTMPSCTGVGSVHAASPTTVPFSQTTTVMAVACKQGYLPSTAMPPATYTVQLNAPTLPPSGTAVNQFGPGTYDKAITLSNHFNFVEANSGATAWVCYTEDSTAPACGTTANTCGSMTAPNGEAATTGTVASGVSKTGTVLNAIACGGTAYMASTAATGTYVLQLDQPDLNPPGVAGTPAAPVLSYSVPTGGIPGQGGNPPAVYVEQNGTGAAYVYACVVNQGKMPACGTGGACTTGTPVNGTFTQGSFGAPMPTLPAAGDTWTAVGCFSDATFAQSLPTTVVFSGPGAAGAPTVNPVGGTFNIPEAPVLTNTDTDPTPMKICYSTDGTPTCVNNACGAMTGTVHTLSVDAVGKAAVNSISLTAGGSGYTAAPAVGFSGGGTPTTNATATSTIQLTAINVVNGGSGYTSAPNVAVSDSTGGGAGFSVVATLTNGVVSGIPAIPAGDGAGYSTPTITIDPPPAGGSQATAAAVGKVDSLSLANPGPSPAGIVGTSGAGYSSAPNVTISGNGGAGATALATITTGLPITTAIQLNGTVLSVTACNADKTQATVTTNTYNFALAEPDFASTAGATTPDLNQNGPIFGGSSIYVTSASGVNFAGAAIHVAVDGSTATCGSPTLANPIAVPTTGTTFTVSAIMCGSSTTNQASSMVRTQMYTLQTGTPVPSTTTQCAGAPPCTATTPATTWDQLFTLRLTSITGGGICYLTTNNGMPPKCNGAAACSNGTFGASPVDIMITQSAEPVAAVGCSALGQSPAVYSQAFNLDVSHAQQSTAPTCAGAGTVSPQGNPLTGGITAGEYICVGTGTTVPTCNGAGSSGGGVTCGAVYTGGATANVPVPAASLTVNTISCLPNFTPTSDTFTNTFTPYRHQGAIALDGALGEWNFGALGPPLAAGENVEMHSFAAGPPPNDDEGLFTYDGSNAYFAVQNLIAAAGTQVVTIYVGNGAAGGATKTPNGFGGETLPTSAGIQYAIEWTTGATTATVQQWNTNNPLDWGTPTATVTVTLGYSPSNHNVEFSVPLSQIAGATPSTISVIEAVVNNAGPGSMSTDWLRDGLTDGAALTSGYQVNYASCLDPNQQLF